MCERCELMWDKKIAKQQERAKVTEANEHRILPVCPHGQYNKQECIVCAQTAKKNDDGKLRYDLIPQYPLSEVAKVYTIGAKKYDDNNWRKGFRYGRVFAAMMRHAWAYWRGEDYDPEDGQHHLASVIWCAMSLMEFSRTKVGQDDRVKS